MKHLSNSELKKHDYSLLLAYLFYKRYIECIEFKEFEKRYLDGYFNKHINEAMRLKNSQNKHE